MRVKVGRVTTKLHEVPNGTWAVNEEGHLCFVFDLGEGNGFVEFGLFSREESICDLTPCFRYGRHFDKAGFSVLPPGTKIEFVV